MSLTERPLLLNRLMRLLSVEVGGGMTPLLAAERLAVFESLLPSFTFQNGPPSCKKLITVSTKHWTKKLRGNGKNFRLLTITVESRAAMATISAHETMPGQTFSTWDLILATTLNPLTELLFGPAVCSPVKEEVSSRSIDPSQPCQKSK